MTQNTQGKSEPLRCPICDKATDRESRNFPFCSPRCRQIDLGRWLKGDYVVSRPIEESDLDEGGEQGS